MQHETHREPARVVAGIVEQHATVGVGSDLDALLGVLRPAGRLETRGTEALPAAAPRDRHECNAHGRLGHAAAHALGRLGRAASVAPRVAQHEPQPARHARARVCNVRGAIFTQQQCRRRQDRAGAHVHDVRRAAHVLAVEQHVEDAGARGMHGLEREGQHARPRVVHAHLRQREQPHRLPRVLLLQPDLERAAAGRTSLRLEAGAHVEQVLLPSSRHLQLELPSLASHQPQAAAAATSRAVERSAGQRALGPPRPAQVLHTIRGANRGSRAGYTTSGGEARARARWAASGSEARARARWATSVGEAWARARTGWSCELAGRAVACALGPFVLLLEGERERVEHGVGRKSLHGGRKKRTSGDYLLTYRCMLGAGSNVRVCLAHFSALARRAAAFSALFASARAISSRLSATKAGSLRRLPSRPAERSM